MISEPLYSKVPKNSTLPNVWWFVFGAAVVLLGIGIYGLMRRPQKPIERVHRQYRNDIARLDSAVHTLQQAIKTKRPAGEAQQAFREARLCYKRVEFLAELYNPQTAKSINGPNLPEVDELDKRIEQPEGLQVLEELLFPYDPDQYEELVTQSSILVSNVGRLGKVAATNEMTDSHVFDAIRLEVFRLVSLGITGFDSPVIHHSLPEAVEVLKSLQHYVAFYKIDDKNAALADKLDRTFTRAQNALRQAPDFDHFDRLNFITFQANVLSSLLLDAQQELAIPVFRESRFLSPRARTLNDSAAFDPAYFVKTTDDRPTPDRIALGKLLFYDPILSGSGKRSCATCHQPDRAFTDGEPTSLAVGEGGQRIRRNAPTLWNASLQAAQFMDSRVAYLEDQANDVIANESEMHGSLPSAVLALKQRPDYRNRFASAYSAGITEYAIQNALASYIRSLISLDSRIDQYLRSGSGSGTPVLLTDEEKQGFNLFMGKAQCATCHFFPLFNGTVPPAFAKTESEVIGTPATITNRRVDADLGRFAVSDMEPHRFAFKTPTVRHATKTAPYMHNGVYPTLDLVVDFYNRGGGNGLGFKLPNQTLPDTRLTLTKPEQQALVAFMKALD